MPPRRSVAFTRRAWWVDNEVLFSSNASASVSAGRCFFFGPADAETEEKAEKKDANKDDKGADLATLSKCNHRQGSGWNGLPINYLLN